MRPGAKYFEWEAKGVPLRLEVGPRDAKAGVAIMAKRTGGRAGDFSRSNAGQPCKDKIRGCRARCSRCLFLAVRFMLLLSSKNEGRCGYEQSGWHAVLTLAMMR